MDVVLVHGLAGSARWWVRVVPPLAARHTVHALDLPRRRPEAWLALRLAELDRPALVGHSLGALYAARLAARLPLAALVLVAPAGLPPVRTPVSFVPPLASALRVAGPRFLARVTLDALRAGPLALAAGARTALAGGLELPDVPTLVVWGGRDRVSPAAPVAARSVVIPGAGHAPMWERPAELAAVLLDFLEESSVSRASASGAV